MARKQNDRASRVEIIAIHKRLEETVTRIEGGMCAYAIGISDQSIADEMKVSRASVQGLRTEIFGKLRQPAPTADARVDDVVKAAENLLASYAVLKDRHNKLVALLALNRVVDCKHLEIK